MGYMIDLEMQVVKKARLLGGMVNKGKVYTIGEQGPETFVPYGWRNYNQHEEHA